MSDARKTRAELIEEVAALRRQVEAMERRPAAGRGPALPTNEAEERYRQVVESATDPIFMFDREGRFVSVNGAAAQSMRCRPEDLLGKRMEEAFPPAVAERQACRVRQVLETGEPLYSEENESHMPAGPQWYNTSLTPVKDEGGKVQYVIGIARDVTRRKQAEEALRQSEENYRRLFEQSQNGVIVLVDGRIAGINQAAADIHGTPIADILGRSGISFLAPEDQSAAQAKYEEAVDLEDGVSAYQVRLVRADGSDAWVEARGSLIQWGGRPALQVIVRDVTRQREAQEALRQSEENYRVLFEENQDGIVVLQDGKVVGANRAFTHIQRTEIEDVLGKTIDHFIHSDDRSVARARHAALMQGQVFSAGRQYRATRSDGSEAWIEARAKLIHWGGRPALQVIVRDITQQLRLEEELRKAHRLEAVGQLAGGIAHDFNNLMTGILCHAGLLKAGAGPGTDVHETATVIEGAARRAADLTGQLLGFARRGKHQDIPVDVGATLRMVVQLLSGTLGPRVQVRTEWPAETLWVRGDPAQLEQAILNLAVNARDAIVGDGEIRFAAAPAGPVGEAGAGRPDARPGAYVTVTVSDSGCGMTPEIQARIFEPFFTTKPPGKGLGMGLAMVYGIVQNHGGWIEVKSAVGRGSSLTLYLPAAPAPPAESGAGEAAASVFAAARILLVDDEEVVRSAVTRMLTNMGHKVAAVGSGQEAIEYYRVFGRQWDLVIIDMVMPAINGAECLRALQKLNPQVRAILCTGACPGKDLKDLLEGGDVGFLRKPYRMEQLAAAIHKALGKKKDE
jgi:two-component system, cell cycle sensor histidine kinase and response regulator CckA